MRRFFHDDCIRYRHRVCQPEDGFANQPGCWRLGQDTEARAGIKALERVPGLYDVYKREQAEAANPGIHERIANKRNAEVALKALAEAIQKQRGGSLGAAYFQACKTPEGAALYGAARTI